MLHAIEQCRTAAMGGHVDACDSCGHLASAITVVVTGIAPNAKIHAGKDG